VEEYDGTKVNKLKDALFEALKNATNIRNLKSDDSITVCVFGGASEAPFRMKRLNTGTNFTASSIEINSAKMTMDMRDGSLTVGDRERAQPS